MYVVCASEYELMAVSADRPAGHVIDRDINSGAKVAWCHIPNIQVVFGGAFVFLFLAAPV